MTNKVFACALLTALALAPAAFAGGEFGVLGGGTWADKDFDGTDSTFAPTFGLKWAHHTSDRMHWAIDGTYTQIAVDQPAVDTDLWALRTGPEFFLSGADRRWRWFIAPALGYESLRLQGDQHHGRGLVSLGLGQKIASRDDNNFNWQVRATQSLGSSGYEGEGLLNYEALIGYAWGYGGAPKDEDGDGVIDRKDKCPGTPAGARVDEKGCPTDSDGDGVFDGLDKCPDTPKGYPVDASGCPLDSDGDGVVDGLDKCPGTPKGTKVDATGCPLPELKQPALAVGATLVLKGVNFDTAKATLRPDSKAILDELVGKLKEFPDVSIHIAGHTDDVGADASNLKLSKDRAKTVLDYLVAAGIAPGRLTSEGYGETKPIADNKTDAGRAENRRVAIERTK